MDHSNMVIGTLPLMGGPLHLVHQGGEWVGCSPRCTECSSPPKNAQCIIFNFILFM